MNSYLKPLTDELTDLWDDGLTIENEKFMLHLFALHVIDLLPIKLVDFLVILQVMLVHTVLSIFPMIKP